MDVCNSSYEKGKGTYAYEPSKGILNCIFFHPCPMWVGLLDAGIFEHKLKLLVIHELHRILTIASILSWGRFYALPEKYLFDDTWVPDVRWRYGNHHVKVSTSRVIKLFSSESS